jgi:hypothetical protein
MRCLRIVGAKVVLLSLTMPPAPAAKVNKSRNVKLVDRVRYKGGTHLAFGGGYAYGGEWNGTSGRDQNPGKGGIRIFDITGRPRQVGFFRCPGNDTDVAFVRRGLIAVGHHLARCNPFKDGEDDAGVYLLDVSNPRRPVQVGQINLPSGMQTHSITVYPGKPIIYSNLGGLPSNGQMLTHMIDISNPAKPKIVGTFTPQAPPTGCHDFSFHYDKRGKFGICSGLQGTQIWDVSDPLAPSVVSTIYNPLIQFSHYAVASKDGKLLAIYDENITANDCVDADTPTGAIWFYDISDIESPQLLSFVSPPRGNTGSPIGSFWVGGGTCTSHDFNFVDKRTVVVPWHTGGFNVLNLKDPSSPKEIAFYQPPRTNMWSAHFYRGRIYTNDMGRGFEVLNVTGL